MLIAKLTISYERGLHRNDARDIVATDGAEKAPKGFVLGRNQTTQDGKIIRGLGTHYESAEVAELVKQRDAHAKTIYTAFRERFLATPLEGVYVVATRGEAREFVENLPERRADVQVYVTEFELTAPGELNESEVRAWGEKVRRQLGSISLGRSKEADEDGLKALEHLASCPILSKQTGTKIKELVAGVRLKKLDRVELKRSIEKLDVKIEQAPLAVEPRRSPKITPAEVA